MSMRGASVPPFPPGYRGSGVLLHLTSLPSAYGIGDLGPAAFAWLDRLHEAGQRWWQALPLGPTGYGDSPYQCLSSFAGNDARMNVPGRADGNWRWRCTEEMLSTRAFEWLRDLTKASGRSQRES
jgi:4-alpha-glucanotransferase